MNFLIFVCGILVGALLMGGVLAYDIWKNDNKPNNSSIQAMKDYIHQLEEDNQAVLDKYEELKERYEIQRRTWGE